MKKFAGHKSLGVIVKQCKAQGIPLNRHLFDTAGWDTVVVNHSYGTPLPPGHVIYNVFNGCFFGKTDKGVDFDSSSVKHEAEPWFQALLSFFYIEKT